MISFHTYRRMSPNKNDWPREIIHSPKWLWSQLICYLKTFQHRHYHSHFKSNGHVRIKFNYWFQTKPIFRPPHLTMVISKNNINICMNQTVKPDLVKITSQSRSVLHCGTIKTAVHHPADGRRYKWPIYPNWWSPDEEDAMTSSEVCPPPVNHSITFFPSPVVSW